MNLVEISRIVKDLTLKARDGKLSPQEIDCGTSTLSNVGGIVPGWTILTPILNQPQAMIVQPGGIFDTQVAREGEVVIRPNMTLSITWDHRILDGAPVIKFLMKIKELIEEPE